MLEEDMQERSFERVVRLSAAQRNRLFDRVLGDEALRCQVELSHTQRRFWSLSVAQGASPALNLTEAFRVTGPLDLAALDIAIERISRRHDQLRARFLDLDGAPVRLVSGAPLRLMVDSDPPAGSVRDIVEQEADRVFDLQTGPLLRCRAIVLGPEDHLLLFNAHQLVVDGMSFGLFYRELRAIYREAAGGPPAELPALPVTYPDHVAYQHELTHGAALTKEVDFWRRTLAGAPVVLDLPVDHPRGPRHKRGALLSKPVPATVITALNALARQENATPFMSRLAAYALVLYRHTGQPDFLIGTAVPGRRPVEQNLIGPFGNEVVVRADLSGNPTFRTLLRRVRRNAFDAFAHAGLPCDVLVDELRIPCDPGRNPLYQVFLTEERQRIGLLCLGAAQTRRMELEPRIPARMDASMAVLTNDDGTAIARIGYEPVLFERTSMEQLVNAYRLTLAAVASNPDARVNDLDLDIDDARSVGSPYS
jgi:hypothetical protein